MGVQDDTSVEKKAVGGSSYSSCGHSVERVLRLRVLLFNQQTGLNTWECSSGRGGRRLRVPRSPSAAQCAQGHPGLYETLSELKQSPSKEQILALF